MVRRLALLLTTVAGLATGAASLAQTSSREGAYSDAQADAGAQLYAARCAMCHGRMLEGTFEIPALRGRFIANWSRAPLGDLYDYLGRAMPQFAPGTLTPEENAQLVAFLLRENAQPAGRAPLPADSGALRRIQLEAGAFPAGGK